MEFDPLKWSLAFGSVIPKPTLPEEAIESWVESALTSKILNLFDPPWPIIAKSELSVDTLKFALAVVVKTLAVVCEVVP